MVQQNYKYNALVISVYYLIVVAYDHRCLLQDLVKRYSEFINFPINLWASKEVETEVPAEEDESAEEETGEL